MIRIAWQDAEHQYDELGREITTWNEKYCGWVINPEYERKKIDWQEDENGITEFPRGMTRKEFEDLCPGADGYPDISVEWKWDEDGYQQAFHEHPMQEITTCYRSWGYLNYSPEEAIECLGRYCNFHIYAFEVIVKYNDEVIYSGELQ